MTTKKQIKIPDWMVTVIFVVVILLLYSLLFPAQQGSINAGKVHDISYSEFKYFVMDGRVEQIELRGDVATGKLFVPQKIGSQAELGMLFKTRIPSFGDEQLLPELQLHNVNVRILPKEGESTLSRVLISLLPWLLFIGIWFWFVQRASKNIVGGGMGGHNELSKFMSPKVTKYIMSDIRFSDVAGQENAKKEVTELVNFLRHPDQFKRLGAEIPRGILLMGPPGTGKTLLAKALAGEANVPFLSITGSEFIEVFVGVGASRVRKLFEMAKQHAPSIIFIDELDSIGRTRGTGLGGGHDEREQTLNQILAEMDGFKSHEAVIVLSATNRPDVLDPALLRPGRFDRHVTLDLPDINDREKILGVHSRKVPLADDVELSTIAGGTPGFSGADLKNLVNEAAILAAREKDDKVKMRYFDDARDKLLLGTARTLAIKPEEQHRLAVHEAGHTLVAFFLPLSDPLYKVTIIPHGHSLGSTHQVPKEERHTLPEDYLRDRLAVILAGRTAESVLLDSVSSGAEDDIRKGTSLARAMVARWGMSKEIGPVDLRESEEHPFLGREIAQPRHFSEASAQVVDKAVQQLVLEAEQRAKDIIEKQRPKLKRLIASLEEHESLDRGQIEQCLQPNTHIHNKAASI